MNGLSFGRIVIVLVGKNLLTVSSNILRKLEYTSLILSELNTIIPVCNIQLIGKPFYVCSIIVSYFPFKGVLLKSFK